MGLVGHFEDNKLDIPLISIQARLVSHDSSGIVTVTQKYVNPCKQRIEAFYVFPLYEDATVISCTIEFRKGKISCAVKEKNLAEKEYKDAKECGQQATLMRETSGEHYDVSVGNMDPLEEVLVIIQYLTTLKWDLAKGSYRFIFPTTIMPRYDNKTKLTNAFAESYNNRSDNSSAFTQSYMGYMLGVYDSKDHNKILYSDMANNVTLELVVECTLYNLLKSIETMDIFNGECLESNISGNQGMIRFGNIKMDRDFIINIAPIDSSPYSYIMQEQYSDGSFTWKIQADAKKIVKHDPNRRFEFIFIVDQSASMAGPQIVHATHVLNTLINSVQGGSIFNVYGFGSFFYSFFQESVDYNETTFKIAKSLIREKVQINMGGAEIYAPLRYIYGLKKRTGFERRIILLTDGEVHNVQELFDICEQDPKTRIYTIGIGNGVSHLLVETLARITGGNCVIATDNELVEENSVYQLKFAMTQPFEAQVGDEKFQIVPRSMLVDHRVVQKGITDEYVQFSVAGHDEDLIFRVIYCGKSDLSPLRLYSIKESLEAEVRKGHDWSKQSSERKCRETKIVNLSTKYNVLCPYTAFVGILESPGGERSAKTLVSPLSPGKYTSPMTLGFNNTSKVPYMFNSLPCELNFGISEAHGAATSFPTSSFRPTATTLFPAMSLPSDTAIPTSLFSAPSSNLLDIRSAPSPFGPSSCRPVFGSAAPTSLGPASTSPSSYATISPLSHATVSSSPSHPPNLNPVGATPAPSVFGATFPSYSPSFAPTPSVDKSVPSICARSSSSHTSVFVSPFIAASGVTSTSFLGATSPSSPPVAPTKFGVMSSSSGPTSRMRKRRRKTQSAKRSYIAISDPSPTSPSSHTTVSNSSSSSFAPSSLLGDLSHVGATSPSSYMTVLNSSLSYLAPSSPLGATSTPPLISPSHISGFRRLSPSATTQLGSRLIDLRFVQRKAAPSLPSRFVQRKAAPSLPSAAKSPSSCTTGFCPPSLTSFSATSAPFSFGVTAASSTFAFGPSALCPAITPSSTFVFGQSLSTPFGATSCAFGSTIPSSHKIGFGSQKSLSPLFGATSSPSISGATSPLSHITLFGSSCPSAMPAPSLSDATCPLLNPSISNSQSSSVHPVLFGATSAPSLSGATSPSSCTTAFGLPSSSAAPFDTMPLPSLSSAIPSHTAGAGSLSPAAALAPTTLDARSMSPLTTVSGSQTPPTSTHFCTWN